MRTILRRRVTCSRPLLASLAVGLALAACASEDSPEARVRALVARAEAGAEARDVGALEPLVSERYADRYGNDRKALKRILTFHFLRNRSIHLLTRVGSITFEEPSRAEVTVFVAMAGRPIAGPADLGRVRADLYRFDLSLQEEGEGELRLIEAAWRPAQVGDFL